MKIDLRYKYTFIIILFLNSLFFSGQIYSVENINQKISLGASAVIRNDETTVTIFSSKRMVVKQKKVITILDKSKDYLSELYFPFDPNNKIKNLVTTIYDKTGKKIRGVKKSEYLDISSSDGFSLYTDNRALVYKYYPVNYPYTIEYEVETESSNTLFLRDYVPLTYRGVAVEHSAYTISNLSGIELRKKIYPTNLFSIQEEKTETGWFYQVNNIAPLKVEALSPSLSNVVPKISFALSCFSLEGKEGCFSSWNEFGKWMDLNLLQGTQNLTDKAKAEIHTLVKDIKSDREKVKILYQYLQNKTRYVNIAIGIGGWKPINASEVYNKGYGDCKALTNFMLTILKEVGIKSFYTVINSEKSEVDFDEEFPKMGGNHVILCVPMSQDTLWLENTSQNMAFNQLGLSTVNRNAILISNEESKVIHTKKMGTKDNTENIKIDINLYEDKQATFKGTMLYKGLQYTDQLNLLAYETQKFQDIYKEKFSNILISSFNTCQVNNNKNEGVFTVSLDFKASRFSTFLGKEMFFDAVPIERMKYNLVKDENRTLPLEILYGYTDSYEFSYIIPQGFITGKLPEDILFTSEFGNYTLFFKEEGNKIVVKRKLVINKGIYSKEKFNEYVKFMNIIYKFDNTKINLIKKI